jgi:hypothetical protein
MCFHKFATDSSSPIYFQLIIPWVEVTGIQGLRSQPLVQERYVRVAIANGDEVSPPLSLKIEVLCVGSCSSSFCSARRTTAFPFKGLRVSRLSVYV